MEQFRTILTSSPSESLLDWRSCVFFVGSCFADSISGRLREGLMEAPSNPYGTVYNPLSAAQQMQRILDNDAADFQVVERDGRFYSYEAHTLVWGASPGDLTEKLKDITQRAHEQLERAQMVVVTFGTAWVYRLGGRVVANCQKQPERLFERSRLSVGEIVEAWQPLLERLCGKRVVFTVSPIRHIKDTLHGNQLSKSTLLLAIDELGVEYFPAYELLMDDLRDYRFYAADMLHPSEVAVDYIYNRYIDRYFTMQTHEYLEQGSKISKMMEHRPFEKDGRYLEYLNMVGRKLESFVVKFNSEFGEKCLKRHFKNVEELKICLNLENLTKS